MLSFNLLDQPWIPVFTQEGAKTDVSLREALGNASRYTGVAHASPLVTVAVYRLMLAVLHRALRGPEDTEQRVDWFVAGEFPSDLLEGYLAAQHANFDLLDAQRPFFQVPDLPLEQFSDPWTRLTAERGSGNTSFLYNHSLREKSPGPVPRISFAEAACRLLEYQTFALGGLLKRYVTSAPGAPAVQGAMILMQGKNLFETLCLNLCEYSRAAFKLDQPVWERPHPLTTALLNNPSGYSEPVLGITNLYTWPTRAIRLRADSANQQIHQVAIAAGVIANSTDLDRVEPMHAFITREDGMRRPITFRVGHELWRDLHALLPKNSDTKCTASKTSEAAASVLEDRPEARATLAVYGINKDQAKVIGSHCEIFRLPPVTLANPTVHNFLRQRLEEVGEVRSYLMISGKVLAEHLLMKTGNRKPFGKDVSALADSFRHLEFFMPRVRDEFLKLLAHLPESTMEFDSKRNSLADRWWQCLSHHARQALSNASTSAGSDGVALKAQVAAERQLERSLTRGKHATKKGAQ